MRTTLTRTGTTARPRAEEALRDSEERFRRIAGMTGEWIWEQDAHGRYIYSSAAVKDILGYRPSEVLGRHYSELFTREHRDFMALQFPENPAIERRFFRLTNRYRHKDGREILTESSGEPLFDRRGTLIKWLGVDRDVTARKHDEQELRRMRAYLKNIIDSMPSMLIGVDSEGRITEWNQGAETSTGKRALETHGRELAEIVPELRPRLHNIREAIERRAPIKSEQLVIEKDGETRFADVMIYPLLGDGGNGVVVRVDDITSRVRMEQLMVQTEKMMSVGGLAAGMAHEINNPLSGVLQSCQNIQRRLSPVLPANRNAAEQLGIDLAQVRAYLEARGILRFIDGMQEAAGRASRIVADMLAFSRHSTIEFAPTRLDELLDATLRLAGSDYDLKKKYDFKQIEIVREFDPGLGPVSCDRTEIEQVFLNLIKNAAQAMAEGSTPPHRITVRTRNEGGHARIDIEDNGPGMDEKTRTRAFEPFFTTKPPGIGTGLGLSVSYFIVTEQHHGSIEVSSTPGRGACFRIRLPMGRDAARHAKSHAAAAAEAGAP